MAICCALLKYGYSNFSVEIIEYCPPSDLLARENYYLASLQPEYNIAKDSSAPFLGRNHTAETKAKLSAAKTGENHLPPSSPLRTSSSGLCPDEDVFV